MSQANVAVIQSIYDGFAAGDVAAVFGAMQPDMVWNEAENFPYADGNPYVGAEAIGAGVFGRIGAEWDVFTVTIAEMLDAGDAVIALGRYAGTYKATGKRIDAQLAHVWRLRDGKAASFQQYVDTLQVARAIDG